MRVFLSLLVVAVLGLVSACGGADGDACQVAGDCSTGLMCCKGIVGADVTARGTCQAMCVYSTPNDAGTDLGTPDAGVTDDMSVEDMAVVDMSVEDSSVPDMTVDMSTLDSGGSEDAGSVIDAAATSDASEDLGTDVDAGESIDLGAG